MSGTEFCQPESSEVPDVLARQAVASERLAEAVEEQNELLRQLVDAVAYGGQC